MSHRPSRVRGRRDGVRVEDAVAIDAAPAGSNLMGLVIDLEFECRRTPVGTSMSPHHP